MLYRLWIFIFWHGQLISDLTMFNTKNSNDQNKWTMIAFFMILERYWTYKRFKIIIGSDELSSAQIFQVKLQCTFFKLSKMHFIFESDILEISESISSRPVIIIFIYAIFIFVEKNYFQKWCIYICKILSCNRKKNCLNLHKIYKPILFE